MWARVTQVVANDLRWAGFRPKLAKWLCLCENFPYRMSFLVLIITNFAQKEQVNRLRHKHPSDRSKYGLVHYTKPIVANSMADTVDCLGLPDDMPIVEAYFRHVDQDIYSSGDFCRKMLGLDGDPVGAALCGCLCPAGI